MKYLNVPREYIRTKLTLYFHLYFYRGPLKVIPNSIIVLNRFIKFIKKNFQKKLLLVISYK